MADFCSLCGTKLSFLGKKPLICANQDEMFCSACHDKLYHMENLERGRYLLEHGNPDNPEKMREFITVCAERTLQKQKLEPSSRPCPNCGGEMKLAIKDFTIGAYADKLFGDQYEVDLYACPECGKVEMYTANFAAVKRNAELKAKKDAEAKATAEADLQAMEKPLEQEYTAYRPDSKSYKKPPWER